MKKFTMTTEEAKAKISTYIGRKIKFSVNKGRKKTEKFTALVNAVFPCVFTLIPEEKKPATLLSYSYSDIICGNVKFKE